MLSRVEIFENGDFYRIRVDGGKRRFSNTMTSNVGNKSISQLISKR